MSNYETVIEEEIKEFWSINGNPNTLSSVSPFHPAIQGQLPKVIEGTIRKAMNKAFAQKDKDIETATLQANIDAFDIIHKYVMQSTHLPTINTLEAIQKEILANTPPDQTANLTN